MFGIAAHRHALSVSAMVPFPEPLKTPVPNLIGSRHAAELIATLRTWPQLTVETDEPEVARIHLHAGRRTIADVVRRPPQLRIRAPRDVLDALQRSRPLARLEADALVFDLRDQRAYRMAVSALRTRAHEEQLAWQMQVESP